MKKLFFIATMSLLLTGCGKEVVIEPTNVESMTYKSHGNYYNEAGGTIITTDGNVWGWTNDDHDIEDGDMVVVLFDNNGTPETIYDDKIDIVIKNYTGIRY